MQQDVALPPKQRYQLSQKRTAADLEVVTDANAQEQLLKHPYSLDEEAEAKQAKQVKITTSKILGTAHPRKPRVGPEYQAVIPPWPVGRSSIPQLPLTDLRSSRGSGQADSQKQP
jgi:hypothetical protein